MTRVAIARAAEKDERLSDGALYGKLAAEIERLKTERKNCPPVSDSEYVRRLEDEIERLRREIGILKALLAQYEKP